jgi:PKD repeat protein
MKKIIRNAALFILATLALQGGAQNINLCAGGSATLTAVNSATLISPSYSINPGGITSPGPNFIVTPAFTTTYTLYATGTDSNSAVVTTSTTVIVQVNPLPITSLSPVTQTVGCGVGVASTATSTAISPASNVTHNWYSPAMQTPLFSDGSQVSLSALSVMGPITVYTCVVTDNATGCSMSRTTSVISSGGAYPTFNLSSSQNFSIGCASRSVTSINIVNPQSGSGGVVSFTLLAPGFAGPSYTTNPTSTYTVSIPGTYTVIVRDNANNCETRMPVLITQNTVAPGVAIGAVIPTLSCNNPSVVLTGIGSGLGSPPLDYNWYFLNGVNLNVINNYSMVAYSQAPFTNIIANAFTLSVVDLNNACENTTVVPVYQNTSPPNAIINGAFGVCQNTISLSNTSTSGILPGTFPISQPIISYLWEGPAPQPTLGISSTYVAQTVGIYTMSVKDMNNGCTNTATVDLNNTMLKPTAAFVHTITGGQAAFNDLSIGTDSNTAYFWDFGDGSTSTQQNPPHTYINAGSYLVKLKVTNFFYCSDSLIMSVYIAGVPCVANSNFSFVPTATAQVWNAIPSFPWNVSAATWSWGDGSTSNTLYASHQFSAAGMYNICLSVTVSCSASSSACASYSVYRSSQEAMVIAVNVIAPGLLPQGLATVNTDGLLSWSIVPNPNAGEFSLNLNHAGNAAVRILITDLTGRIVHKQQMEAGLSSAPVLTGNLPSGMYLVNLESEGLKATRRLIVNH